MRARQLDKLARLKAERDDAQVAGTLGELTRIARSGDGNLLAAAVDAARAMATVGEISLALETVWNRHVAETQVIHGVYRKEIGEASESLVHAQAMVDAFEETEGRKPRILVAKMGQDGHDRGQKVIATAFADIGFQVDIGPLFSTPEEVARQAVENDVHVVGVSSLAAGHLTLVPALRAALEAEGRSDIMIAVGGVVPPQDFRGPAGHGRGHHLPARHSHRRRRHAPAHQAERQAGICPGSGSFFRGACRRGRHRLKRFAFILNHLMVQIRSLG